MEWYRIKQVAEQTGLSEQLIRKWEQRYGAVQPRRLENGYRMYSSEDIHRLMALKQIVDNGTSVSQAVEEMEVLNTSVGQQIDFDRTPAQNEESGGTRLGQPLNPNGSPGGTSAGQPPASGDTRARHVAAQPELGSEWVNTLIVAGTEGRTREIKQILHRCYVVNGFRTLVNDVIVPFLQIVGMLWEEGSWSEDQEHLSSLSVRDFLIQRMADLPDAPDGAPMLLASCIPGERHDIMLNMAMLEAKRLGFATAFLGAEPAPGAIERAVQRLRPRVLLLSATSDRPFVSHPEHQPWLLTLDGFAETQPGTRFCFGGPKPIVDLCTNHLRHIHAVESLEQLFAELEAIVRMQVG